ncbi:MAG: hypothetical protein KFKLKKLM_02442 [Flavobacteriales bacterium]|nr:hypothetical protein [Flavobacteriales bacterium]
MSKSIIFLILICILSIIAGTWFLIDSLKRKKREETFRPRLYYIIESIGLILIGLYVLFYLLTKTNY